MKKLSFLFILVSIFTSIFTFANTKRLKQQLLDSGVIKKDKDSGETKPNGDGARCIGSGK